MSVRDDETVASSKFADVPFALAAFVASALLFVVQPMAAKQLLPTLGGAPAVWTTSVLVFQLALLIGYAWAHLGPRWLGDRRHAVVHAVLLVVACVTLPIGLAPGWRPPEGQGPVEGVMLALVRSVGLPLCVLCATSPLIQRWHVALRPNAGDRVYRLYAIGNVASLLVLLAYPIAIEPTMTLRGQLVAWSGGFVALAVLLVALAWRRLRLPVGQAFLPVFDGASAQSNPSSGVPLDDRQECLSYDTKTNPKTILAWVGLSAVASSLMLGVTSYLTSDVAAVPFLWVAPLALYLAAFSLAFASRAPGAIVGRCVAPGLAMTCLLLVGLTWNTLPLGLMVGVHLGAFFLLCWCVLATLYDRRPTAPSALSGYYLWIAVGGCVGGAFNSLLAPVIYDTVIEYPLGLLVAAAIALVSAGRRATEAAGDRRVTFGKGLVIALLAACAFYAAVETRVRVEPTRGAVAALLLAPVAICALAWLVPVAASVPAGVVAVSVLVMSFGGQTTLLAHRSFFGVHRIGVTPQLDFLMLLHGTTLHGLQTYDRRTGAGALPEVPLTYYHREGPLGETIRATAPQRIGVVGLGGGTIAAYVGAGQSLTYFEIDPIVIRLADGRGPFTYVPAAKERGASVEIVEGDARLTLAQGDRTFDLLVVDAFSGDAVPAHLLTRQAFELYARRLAPGGTLAVHVSNRYLNLVPVVSAGAGAIGGRVRVGDESTWRISKPNIDGAAASTWVVITRDPDVATRLSDPHWTDAPAWDARDAWTDDFSNLLRTLR